MIRFIIKRLLLMIPTLLGIALLVLLFIVITPGDPARLMMGDQFSEEELEAFRVELGLRDPFHVRYFNYISDILQGDFGTSIRTGRSVADDMILRAPFTLILVFVSLVLAIIIGVPLGIYAATRQYTWKDNAAIFISLFCVSMPTFWFALMLIQIFAVQLGWVPPSGVDSWQGWILPAVTGALGFSAFVARQMRSNLLEVIRQDYITTARAKGLSEAKVLYRHGLKNASIPVIMVVGSLFGTAMGGSIITEVIFSIPGLGSYTVSALMNRDFPVIQSSVLLMSVMFAFLLLIIDLLFAVVDPRVRSQYMRRKSKKQPIKEVAVNEQS